MQISLRMTIDRLVRAVKDVRESSAYYCNHYFRTAVTYLTIGALIITAVAACSGAPRTEVPTPAYTPTPIVTTARPTAYPTLEKPTQAPTSTPINFANLDPVITGMGEHGNMTFINYSGHATDLEGIVLSADFFQNGKVVEANVPAQTVEGRVCFENVDAKYTPDVPVEVKFDLKEPTGKALATKTYVMKAYTFAPFILPMFRLNDIGDAPFSAEPYHYYDYSDGTWMTRGKDADYYATDICLSPRCQEGATAPGEGLAIYMPGTIRLVQGSIPDPFPGDTRRFTNWNIYFEVPSTGFLFFIGHVQPGPALKPFLKDGRIECGYPPSPNCGIQYDPNAVIAFIGPQDAFSGTPHAHMAVQRPNALTSPYYGYDERARAGVCPDDVGPCGGVHNINISKYLLQGWIK